MGRDHGPENLPAQGHLLQVSKVYSTRGNANWGKNRFALLLAIKKAEFSKKATEVRKRLGFRCLFAKKGNGNVEQTKFPLLLPRKRGRNSKKSNGIYQKRLFPLLFRAMEFMLLFR